MHELGARASAATRTGSRPRSRWRSGSPGPGAPARRVWVTMRTPGHDFELAAGWLVHEGLLAATPPGDDRLLHRRRPGAGAGVQRGHGDPRRRRPPATPGTGTPRIPAPRPAGSAARTASPRPSPSPRAAVGRRACPPPTSYDACPTVCASTSRSSTRTGGVHAAGLATAEGEPLVVREDVGRHNAVDKVTGARVLAGRSAAEACLVVSGRAGFELVQKAVAAGVGSLVAVGAPTSLAVRPGRAGRAGPLRVHLARPGRALLLRRRPAGHPSRATSSSPSARPDR